MCFKWKCLIDLVPRGLPTLIQDIRWQCRTMYAQLLLLLFLCMLSFPSGEGFINKRSHIFKLPIILTLLFYLVYCLVVLFFENYIINLIDLQVQFYKPVVDCFVILWWMVLESCGEFERGCIVFDEYRDPNQQIITGEV